jgi:RNA polymerase sigma-70 factor (ECF subfamily)
VPARRYHSGVREPDERRSRKLVERASRGDAPAVEELLERHLADLRRYVRRHAGDLLGPRESSDDLVQSVCRELFERMADARFEYRGEAEFKQWLYRAAVLKILARRRYRGAGKRDAGELRAGGGGSDSSAAVERAEALFLSLKTPSEDAMLREEFERFADAFERLPENYQRVIALAHVEDLPHRDIAARMGISEPNARMLLSRALARMATLRAKGSNS